MLECRACEGASGFCCKLGVLVWRLLHDTVLPVPHLGVDIMGRWLFDTLMSELDIHAGSSPQTPEETLLWSPSRRASSIKFT